MFFRYDPPHKKKHKHERIRPPKRDRIFKVNESCCWWKESCTSWKKVSIPRDVQGFIHVGWLALGFLHHQHVSFQGGKTKTTRPKNVQKARPGRSNSPAISRDKGWIRTKECTWGIRTLEMEPKNTQRVHLFGLKHPKNSPLALLDQLFFCLNTAICWAGWWWYCDILPMTKSFCPWKMDGWKFLSDYPFLLVQPPIFRGYI